MSDIIKWLILLVVLFYLYWLYLQIANKWQKQKTQVMGSGSGQASTQGGTNFSSDFDSDQDRFDAYLAEEEAEREAEREAARRSVEEAKQKALQEKKDLLSELARQNPELLQDFLSAAGLGDYPMDSLIDDPEALEKMARKLDKKILQILKVATNDTVVNLDLNSGTKLEEVGAGGVFNQVGTMRNLSEVTRMRPVEYAYPKSMRRQRMVTGQATVTRHYQLAEQKKRFLVLEDVSGSMNEDMSDGQPRYVWARGVILKLTYQAIEGRTEFIYRAFDDEPKKPETVTSRQEAREFLKYITSKAPSGGGTNIFNAFHAAVSSIKEDEEELSEAEILLITDGSDGSMDDTQKIRKMLGNQIRFHVIVIGGGNKSLKEVADSYQTVG